MRIQYRILHTMPLMFINSSGNPGSGSDSHPQFRHSPRKPHQPPIRPWTLLIPLVDLVKITDHERGFQAQYAGGPGALGKQVGKPQ
jgi:hypothetical protein